MPDNNPNLHPDLPELSNEDVAILYEIINVSSQSPDIHTLPFRAIFAAYDEVLAKHGISPAHDQLYLRFLFRLGERLGQGDYDGQKDLFTEFEALLLELGIKIEVGSTQGSVVASEEPSVYDENGENEVPPDTIDYANADTTNEFSFVPTRTRRASFSEVLDITETVGRADRVQPDSPSSISRLQNTSDGFGSRPYTRRRQRRASHDAVLDTTELSLARSRIEAGSRDVFGSHRRRTKDNRPKISKSAPRNRRHGNVRSKDALNFEIYEDSSASEFVPHRKVKHNPVSHRTKPNASERSRARLLKDAEVFDSFRLQNLSKHLIEKWSNILAQRQLQRARMQLLAIQYDRRELMKQAWNELFAKYNIKKLASEARKRDAKQKRESEERERYIQWREDNAAQARNTYLVAKAFSHWANLTSERVKENVVARQHLIRLRYFNAWKEVTVVNDIKVRRMIFRKFLHVWRHRLHDISIRRHQAMILHENSILQSSYYTWFWQFCERRAPEWYNARLKQKFLLKWIIAVRIRAEQKVQLNQNRLIGTRQHWFQAWAKRSQERKGWEQQADQSRRKTLTSMAISQWKLQTAMAPLARQVKGMVNWRIVSTAFAAFSYRSSVKQQVGQIEQRRLLRNAWATWNDELRVRTMQHQIHDRLLVQTLYKWVLAERGALMKRVHEERMQQNALQRMIEKRVEVNRSLREAELLTVQLRNNRLKKAVTSIWYARQIEYQDGARKADALYGPRVMVRLMNQWHAAHEHEAEITRWSVEAAFYLRGKRSIKKWQAAAQESQKLKRREAYTAVKRVYNKNLAKTAFKHWLLESKRSQTLQIIEHDFQVQRAEKLLSIILDHWYQRTDKTDAMLAQSALYDENKLSSSALQLWKTRSQVAATNHATAVTFYDTRIQKSAYDNLRHFQLKILTLQAHQAKASSVLTWNSRRRARGLLRAWAERTASRRAASLTSEQNFQPMDTGPLLPHGISLISLARTPRTNRRGQPFSTTLQAPVEQPFLPEIQPQTPFLALASQLPTYLSTPSNRAARAKATSNIQTPFRQQASLKPTPGSGNSKSSPLHNTTAEQQSEREQSYTPPTAAAKHSRTLRFAESEDQTRPTIETPLRIPAPTPAHNQTLSAATQAGPGPGTISAKAMTDQQPRRRQYIARNFGGGGGGRGASINADGRGVFSASTAGTGVRRSLFPKARRVESAEDNSAGDATA